MSGLIKPNDMKFVPKSWGYEVHIVNNEKYCGKKLFIRQGKWLSYHYHEIKDEVLFVESGRVYFTFGSSEQDFRSIEMGPGQAFHVQPGLIHQIQAVEDTMIFEFSTQHFDSDSHRTSLELMANHEAE